MLNVTPVQSSKYKQMYLHALNAAHVVAYFILNFLQEMNNMSWINQFLLIAVMIILVYKYLLQYFV